MSWSAEQHRMLSAMGFEPMVRATMATVLQDRQMPIESSEAAHGTANVENQAASFPELQLALRRAAGDQDVSSLVGDLARLRREPALKRALWPRLRALRRSH